MIWNWTNERTGCSDFRTWRSVHEPSKCLILKYYCRSTYLCRTAWNPFHIPAVRIVNMCCTLSAQAAPPECPGWCSLSSMPFLLVNKQIGVTEEQKNSKTLLAFQISLSEITVVLTRTQFWWLCLFNGNRKKISNFVYVFVLNSKQLDLYVCTRGTEGWFIRGKKRK
jgi:hypothetical protein